MTNTHIAIESTYRDGTKAYRFVEGTGRQEIRFANEQASRFERRQNVASVRTYDVTAEEVARIRDAAKPE